jgi:hypothetical protein
MDEWDTNIEKTKLRSKCNHNKIRGKTRRI